MKQALSSHISLDIRSKLLHNLWRIISEYQIGDRRERAFAIHKRTTQRADDTLGLFLTQHLEKMNVYLHWRDGCFASGYALS
jgi:hypothetical protein